MGCYPVRARQGGILFVLPVEWSMQQAIAINKASLPWDGIESMTEDGTIFFTEETQQALFKYLGKPVEKLSAETAQEQATDLLRALN